MKIRNLAIRSVFISQVLIALIFAGCRVPESGIILHDLRCENLSEPLGIGTTNPRFSWKIRSERNSTSQKAYQILVASNPDLLNVNGADLWNSGKIVSAASILVPYHGEELTSPSACYWTVRVWDENDNPSDFGEVESFSIGLTDESDWKADYIGLSDPDGRSISPQLRKTFDLQDKQGKVFLYVNSLGYHEVFLNGGKVGDYVLTPAVSQFNKRSLVITYDITSLVRQGSNDLVLWIAQGWYAKGLPGVTNNGPLVKAQIEQVNQGRWSTVLCTDSTWTGRNSGYCTTGTGRSGKFGGERIDGSLLLPDLSGPTLDKTTWRPVLVDKTLNYEVSPQMTESNRIGEVIKPLSIQPDGDGSWLVDMGKSLTGWLEIRLPPLQVGQEVVIEYSDHLDKAGKLYNQNQSDTYVASGKPGEIFCNKFNYHGFRYLKISNLPSEPAKESMTAFLIHTDYRMASSFECSDPDLNAIHNMVQYTLRCLSLGGYLVDCPQIERLGYGGDGNASTETAQTMFDLDPLYNNWLQTWADCVREDGGMPHTAPNPYPAGGGPYWCGFIITASWRTFCNYGDIRILEKYYPIMQQWLGYVKKHSPAGLLEPWPETDYRTWYLGDWASPEGTDQTNKASIDLVNNCFIAVCLETMQKIAGVLGKTDDFNEYMLKKEQIKKLVHEQLFDPSQNKYGSGSQIDLTYPLLAGIVPDSLIKAVKQNLYDEIENNHDGHIACGLVGIPVFTEWAVRNHEADLMYSILKKKDYPGYLYMIDNGATTTWEHWNGERSRIHNCYNGIGSWFYQAVGGIQPDERFPGYQRVLINPQVPAGITWANTSKETPHGPVSVKWRSTGKILTMDIKIPVGCAAGVTIPQEFDTYQLNGKRFKKSGSLVEVDSGEYKFLFSINK